jgi:hypothetical protein
MADPSDEFEPWSDEDVTAAKNDQPGRRRQRANYLPDPEDTALRIADLAAAVDQALDTLNAAVAVARHNGLTWAKLGEALGITKQGAILRYQRSTDGLAGFLRSDDETEYERIERLIGARSGQVRWMVRRVASGAVGVSRVTWEDVSGPHVLLEVAERNLRAYNRAAERQHPGYLFKLLPDGKEERMDPAMEAERRAKAKTKAEAAELRRRLGIEQAAQVTVERADR